jgi:hypothetical protein
MNHLQPREMILAAVVLLTILAFFYRYKEVRNYQSLQQETQTTLSQIREITDLKRIWSTKGLRTKLDRLKGVVPATSFKVFSIEQHKAHLRAEGLDGLHLNRLLSRIGSLPVAILSLKVQRQGDRYTMECRCKW